MLNGFPSALAAGGLTDSDEGRARSRPIGGFECIPYSVAAHKTRHLHFVKWRLEKFSFRKESILEELRQEEPWKWDQPGPYRFWALGPFSAVLATGPGFSRRSSYHETRKRSESRMRLSQRVALGNDMGRFGEELVICPWMVFKGEGKSHPTPDRLWHLIVQIRIKTDLSFMEQRRAGTKPRWIENENGRIPEGPVHALVRAIEEEGFWRAGDAVFTSLGWSQIVLFLGPRTLREAFDFKNALQGKDEVDRTQTTFGTLFREEGQRRAVEEGFCFRSVIRLGEIRGDAYNELQEELLAWEDAVKCVEEMPGIFDLQILWNRVPSVYDVLALYDIGQKISARCPLADSHSCREPSRRLGALISDVQTTVTRF